MVEHSQDLETHLATEIFTLFQREHLAASQAKGLLEKVRLLVEAGEIGSLTRSIDLEGGLFVRVSLTPGP